ncbi:MAG TPA: biotin--[acetyl-CoA-carboxylase] ligase [Abditibacteriaceae bacterium]|jgi:BirA family biotin operon repressor/biotin-[acetyl-CoA-carboxylase] ligase
MLGTPRRDFQLCASTNDEAARWARDGAPHGAVVVAEAQSRGRGRSGRVWNSPSGCGLYFSLVVRMDVPLARVPLLTMAAALGTACALDEYVRGASVKWPNDVLVHRKKIGGLLSEAAPNAHGLLDFAVIGIGLNIAHEENDLPSRPLFPATSLWLEARRRFERDDVLQSMLNRIEPLLLLAQNDSPQLLEQWMKRDVVQGSTVEIGVGHEAWRGVAAGVEENGALLVRDAQGQKRRVVAGDVFMIQ